MSKLYFFKWYIFRKVKKYWSIICSNKKNKKWRRISLEQSIKLAVESLGANLYDIVSTKAHDRNIFRVLVTAEGGISLDKCAEISRMISPILDVDEPMNGEYILEVSSPGIERKLRTKEHFKASVGEKVKVKDFATET